MLLGPEPSLAIGLMPRSPSNTTYGTPPGVSTTLTGPAGAHMISAHNVAGDSNSNKLIVSKSRMEIAMNRLKFLALMLTLILIPLAQSARAQSGGVGDTAKIKSEIAKRVEHKKARVKIKLRTGEELKGQLEQPGDDKFTLVQDKTGKRLELAYSDVAKVSGRGMSTFTKVGIVAAIGVGVVVIVAVIAVKNFDPFSGGIRVP